MSFCLKNKCKDALRNLRASLIRRRMHRLPELPSLPGNTIIVAPHPDDEILGCGGLIARLCAEGRPPHVIILTRGEGSHRGCCNLPADELAEARHSLTLQAAKLIGLPESHIHPLSLPDGNITTACNEELKRTLELCTMHYALCTILVPHPGEGWPDHVNTRQLVLDMIAAHAPADCKVNVYEYCVWMWYYMARGLDWKNAYAFRMSREEHEKKLRAMDAYVLPKAPCGKPWSGMLPKVFLEANRGKCELYFKVK